MKIVKAYKCSFCGTRVRKNSGKIYSSKPLCEAHEHKCFDNPASRSCATCKHLIRPDDPEGDDVAGKYACTAKKPGKPLTTACKSWKSQVEE